MSCYIIRITRQTFYSLLFMISRLAYSMHFDSDQMVKCLEIFFLDWYVFATAVCGQAILLSIIIWLGWGMINCNPGGILGTLLFEVSRFAKNGWNSTLMFTWIIPTPMCLVDKKTSLILNDECKKFHPWILLYIYFIIVSNYLTIILQPGRYFSLFFELWYRKGRH